MSNDSIANATHEHPIECDQCHGEGIDVNPDTKDKGDCAACEGLGWFGIDPVMPVPFRAGAARIPYYQVRYASGKVIFNQLDGLSSHQIDTLAKECGVSTRELIEHESKMPIEKELQLA